MLIHANRRFGRRLPKIIIDFDVNGIFCYPLDRHGKLFRNPFAREKIFYYFVPTMNNQNQFQMHASNDSNQLTTGNQYTQNSELFNESETTTCEEQLTDNNSDQMSNRDCSETNDDTNSQSNPIENDQSKSSFFDEYTQDTCIDNELFLDELSDDLF